MGLDRAEPSVVAHVPRDPSITTGPGELIYWREKTLQRDPVDDLHSFREAVGLVGFSPNRKLSFRPICLWFSHYKSMGSNRSLSISSSRSTANTQLPGKTTVFSIGQPREGFLDLDGS